MSENYRSLTRTYRPRTFDDIVSQEHVSSTLKNALQKNRLAHAYMFCGPRGVGKTTMARVLARTVNDIEKEVDGESLNQTLNVIEIDAASNNKVDDIRDLREKVRVPPQNGRYKIYIIDEVHMLSKSAFNALLKTLEEPPDHVIFIFATTEPHKVLPTILSRVQRFDFKRISIDEIVDRLSKVAGDQGISIDQESLHVIAKKADGALRDALGLMDQAIAFCGSDIQHEELLRALNVVSTERMFDFMEAVKTKDAQKGLDLINELLQEGYDIQEYLVGLTEHLRNLYVAASSANMHLVEASPDTKKRYKKSAEAFSEDDLMRMLHIVSEAQYKLKEAQQPKIQFEITLLKLIHMERTENINKLLGQLEELKKKAAKRQKLTSSSEDNTVSDSEPQSTNGQQTQEQTQEQQNSSGQPADTSEHKPTETDNHDKEQPSAQSEDESYSSSANEGDEVTKQKETEPAKEDENLTNLFGKSSLDKPSSVPSQTTTQTKPKEPQTQTKKPTPSKAPKDISLEETKSQWEGYLEELRHHVPQMLYFQMQRVEPVEIKNGELTLRCNDDFAKKIVDENDRRLGKLLEDKIGAFLIFNCTVRQKDNSTKKSMSPYERFKNLQKRDPKIKKLVELFGAELDYNLNQ